MQKHEHTAFTIGREFTVGPDKRYRHRKGVTRYKVKETKYREDYEGRDGWFVIAWRFIKTTQKYSGNAYIYQMTYFDGAEFIDEAK